jgi:alpha,alpha-trehalose phosphorylase
MGWPGCATTAASCRSPNKQVRDLRFQLTVRNQLLAVALHDGGATYLLEQGNGLTVYHRKERLDLKPGEPVHRS